AFHVTGVQTCALPIYTVARVLDVLMGARELPARVPDPDSRPVEPDTRDAWEVITASRRPERPGVRDLLRHGASHVLPLRGTGQRSEERRVGKHYRARW